MRKRIEAVKTKQKSQFEAKRKKGMKRHFAVNDKVLKGNNRKDSRKGDRLTVDWLALMRSKRLHQRECVY